MSSVSTNGDDGKSRVPTWHPTSVKPPLVTKDQFGVCDLMVLLVERDGRRGWTVGQYVDVEPQNPSAGFCVPVGDWWHGANVVGWMVPDVNGAVLPADHAQQMHATEVERSRELAEQLTAEIAAVKAERNRLQSLVTELNDKADLADKYERWLLDIGRVIGCQHLDEQFPNCVIRELQGFGELNGEIARLQSELADERRWQELLRELNKDVRWDISLTNGLFDEQEADDVSRLFVAYDSMNPQLHGHSWEGPTPAAAVDAAAKALGVTFEDEQVQPEPDDVPASVLDAARRAWRLFARNHATSPRPGMSFGTRFVVNGIDHTLSIKRTDEPQFIERAEDRTDAAVAKSLATDESERQVEIDENGTPQLFTASKQDGIPGHCIVAQVFGPDGNAVAKFTSTADPEVASRHAKLCAETLNRHYDSVSNRPAPRTDSSGRDDTVPRFTLTPDGCGVLDCERPGMVVYIGEPRGCGFDASDVVQVLEENHHRNSEHYHWAPYTPPEAAAPEPNSEPSTVEQKTLDRLERITEQMEAGTYEAKVTTVKRPNPQVGETWKDGYGTQHLLRATECVSPAFARVFPLESDNGSTWTADGFLFADKTDDPRNLVRRVDSISEPNQEHADGQQQVGGSGDGRGEDRSANVDTLGVPSDTRSEYLADVVEQSAGSVSPVPHPGDVTPSGTNPPLKQQGPPFSEAGSPPSNNPPLVIEVGGRYLCRDGVTTARIIGTQPSKGYPFRATFSHCSMVVTVRSDGRQYHGEETDIDLIRRLPDVVTVEVDPEIVAFLKSQGARPKLLGSPKLGEPYVDPGTMALETCSEFDSDKFVLVCEIVEPIPASTQEGT